MAVGLQMLSCLGMGDVCVHAGSCNIRESPSRFPKQQEEVAGSCLAFVPTLHLADEVAVAIQLQKHLEVGEALPFESVCIAGAYAVSPGKVLRWAATASFCGVWRVRLAASSRASGGSGGDGEGSQGGRYFARSSAELQRLHAAAGSAPLLLWGYVKEAAAFGVYVALGALHAQAVCPYRHLATEFIASQEHLKQRLPSGLTVKAALLPQQQQRGGHIVELRHQKINKLLREQTETSALAALALTTLHGILQQRAAAEAAAEAAARQAPYTSAAGDKAVSAQKRQAAAEVVEVRLLSEKKVPRGASQGDDTVWDWQKDALPAALVRRLQQRLMARQNQQREHPSVPSKGYLAADMGLLAIAAVTAERISISIGDAPALSLQLPLFLLTFSPIRNNEQQTASGRSAQLLVGCTLDFCGSIRGSPFLKQFARQQQLLQPLAEAPTTAADLRVGAVVRCLLTRVTPSAAVATLVGSRVAARVYIHPSDALPPLADAAHQHQEIAWLPPPLADKEALPPSPLNLLKPQQEVCVLILAVHRFKCNSSESESESEDEEHKNGDILASLRKPAKEVVVISAGLFKPQTPPAALKTAESETVKMPNPRKRRGALEKEQQEEEQKRQEAQPCEAEWGSMILLRALPTLRCKDTALADAAADTAPLPDTGDARRFLVQNLLLAPRVCSAASALLPKEIEQPFDSVKEALLGVQRWRFPEGICCVGRIQQLLRPPFGVSVQLTQLLLASENGERALRIPLLASVHLTELTDEWISQPLQRLQLAVGQFVKVKVLPPLPKREQQQQVQHMTLQASLRQQIIEGTSSDMQERTSAPQHSKKSACRPEAIEAIQKGDSLPGLVVSSGSSGIFAALSRSLTVRIRLQHASAPAEEEASRDESSGLLSLDELKERFPPGTLLPRIHILSVDYVAQRIEGSLRPAGAASAARSCTDTAAALKGRRTAGRKTLLLHRYQGGSTAGSADGVSELEKLRLRLLQCICKGQIVEGTVRRVESYGIFVRVSLFDHEAGDSEGPVVAFLKEQQQRKQGKKNDAAAVLEQVKALQCVAIDALCPSSRLGALNPQERARRLAFLKEGDLVQARVLSVQPIKVSHRDSADLEAAEQAAADAKSLQTWPSIRVELSLDPADLPPLPLEDGQEDAKHPASLAAMDVEDADCAVGAASVVSAGGSLAQTSRQRDAEAVTADSDDGSSDDSDEEIDADKDANAAKKGKLSKRDKQRKRRELQESVEALEAQQQEQQWTENPQSEVDFERLLLIHGNAAAVWISYMAWYLKLGEVAKARAVAERGIKQASFASESERFAVWMGYLNLECLFGSKFNEAFKRALQYLDPKQVYYQGSFVLEKANKITEAIQTVIEGCSKFPESYKMWLRAVSLQFIAGKDPAGGRGTMLKALHRLPRRKHIKFVCSCARLEYHYGTPERGQTYYEKLLAEHPKRTDVWCLYLDQHISLCTPPRREPSTPEPVRLIFQRAISLPLKPHKMKSLFARWLAFERKYGTPQTQQKVQHEAREYVLRVEAQLLTQGDNR
ncbi:pre-rRNA processing protein [Cyclospora cayetanensis]|uniref:Pre-rRNA processing protein n=1 Tax=Cyclospora cayetanensis TaxID=88456 RepID=A0A1D3D916_9EIME|nr:pre-rRNA processing protein [Cyclospora cayetanensis]